MGCDIHLFVEARPVPDEPWVLAPGQLLPCEHCNGSGVDPDSTNCINCDHPFEEHLENTACLFAPMEFKDDPRPCAYCDSGLAVRAVFYQGPRYELFGKLSGVRGDSVEQTQFDRGFPADVCAELRHLTRDDGYHSHGYYTLEELEAFPLNTWEPYPDFMQVIHTMRALKKQEVPSRIVFCYDS